MEIWKIRKRMQKYITPTSETTPCISVPLLTNLKFVSTREHAKLLPKKTYGTYLSNLSLTTAALWT